jgi:hypothetical protein
MAVPIIDGGRDYIGWIWRRSNSLPEAGRHAALAAEASFSHHAQGGGIWPDGAGMPDPSRKRPTNQPGTRPMAGRLIRSGRLRWLRSLPLAA